MAWNPKALKALKTPQSQGLDRFDREAEQEGRARTWMKHNNVGPTLLGRRISKETRNANGIAKTAEHKATQHIVKETARIVKERIIPQTSLTQV